mmetsp:Transcript_29282/g.61630  ORF Transcript_29282/g.61630 Transcript_29282/m.61630 type:complete len:265 (-) Transcript_29282:253-1047(-)
MPLQQFSPSFTDNSLLVLLLLLQSFCFSLCAFFFLLSHPCTLQTLFIDFYHEPVPESSTIFFFSPLVFFVVFESLEHPIDSLLLFVFHSLYHFLLSRNLVLVLSHHFLFLLHASNDCFLFFLLAFCLELFFPQHVAQHFKFFFGLCLILSLFCNLFPITLLFFRNTFLFFLFLEHSSINHFIVLLNLRFLLSMLSFQRFFLSLALILKLCHDSYCFFGLSFACLLFQFIFSLNFCNDVIDHFLVSCGFLLKLFFLFPFFHHLLL